jgi:hypothetical protein
MLLFFFLFPTLKQHLLVHVFEIDNNVETAVKWWLKQQNTDWYGQRIQNLILWYDECFSLHWEYVEK